MKIALVQTHIVWEDKITNISKLEKVISDNPDVDLFLLPEMSFTGFSMNTGKTADHREETKGRIKKIAIEHNVLVGFGWVRPAGKKCENVYTIIGKQGATITEYVKIHPFSWSGEDKYFKGGTEINIYEIQDIPFSTFICYDLRFPEIFRSVCNLVHAVIIPANWPSKRAEHWKTLLRARAIENQIYIFAINCVGNINGINYSGDSCVINPNGDMIEMLSNQEGVLKYDFIDDVPQFRKAFPVLQDIKPCCLKESSNDLSDYS